MTSKQKMSEGMFRTILAILCLLIGTFLSIISAFLSFIPLFVGLIVAIAGLVLFFYNTFFCL